MSLSQTNSSFSPYRNSRYCSMTGYQTDMTPEQHNGCPWPANNFEPSNQLQHYFVPINRTYGWRYLLEQILRYCRSTYPFPHSLSPWQSPWLNCNRFGFGFRVVTSNDMKNTKKDKGRNWVIFEADTPERQGSNNEMIRRFYNSANKQKATMITFIEKDIINKSS